MYTMENRRIAVRAVIINDDKLLCVRLKGKDRVTPQDYWCLPGGGVDDLEALVPALERELVEETGIKPVVGNLLYIQQFEHQNREHLELFFHVTNSQDYKNIDLEKTSHGATEIAEIAFIDPTTNNVLPDFLTNPNLIQDAVDGVTKIFDYVSSSADVVK